MGRRSTTIHPQRQRGARHRRGFTLIEVLVALMLMVIVLPVVMGGLGAATRTGSMSKSRAVAISLAESKLAETVAEGGWRRQMREVPFGPAYGAEAERYTWTLDVQNWNDAAVQELTLEVRWHQHGREHVERLVTLVPAEEDAP